MEGFRVQFEKSNLVPVFEVLPEELEPLKAIALESGARVIINISEHPDKLSYVLADPSGNEFEITKFKD
jgi:hypothetical protein